MMDAYFFRNGVKTAVLAGKCERRLTAYFCKECGARVIYRVGEIRVPHFAHHPNDPKGALCPYRTVAHDYEVGDGTAFRSRGTDLPLHQVLNEPFEGPHQDHSFVARLQLWIQLHCGAKEEITLQSFLELPKLPVDSPALDRLHDLTLRVHGSLDPGANESWRLWPGQLENRVPVVLQGSYCLQLEGSWPSGPTWNPEALRAASLDLWPARNVFIFDTDEPNSPARLTGPTRLEPGVTIFDLRADGSNPPPDLEADDLGEVVIDGESWSLYRLVVPQSEDISEEAQEWLGSYGWEIGAASWVRVVSPPPTRIEQGALTYHGPDWMLVRFEGNRTSSEPVEAWRIARMRLGEEFVLTGGRGTGKVKFDLLSLDTADIPQPRLVLRLGGKPLLEEVLNGGHTALPQLDARQGPIEIQFISPFPLTVLAGVPGQESPVPWRPDGAMNALGEKFTSVVASRRPYRVVVLGPGIPRHCFSIHEIARRDGEAVDSYHFRIRRQAGWPSYLQGHGKTLRRNV